MTEAVETPVQNGGLGDVSLKRCEISFVMNIEDVDDLGEALDVAAINIGRFGMDSFYVFATDPDTDRTWVLHNGTITTREELFETQRALREVLDNDPDEDGLDDDPNEASHGDPTE